jgi:hypothetical protein
MLDKNRENMPVVPEDLKPRILSCIRRAERRRLAIKMAGFGAAFAGSVGLGVFGFMRTAAEASQSGFLSFASLLVSDFSLAAANLSDFALSMVESFPAFSAALLLTGVFFAIWSAARFANEIALLRGNGRMQHGPGLSAAH